MWVDSGRSHFLGQAGPGAVHQLDQRQCPLHRQCGPLYQGLVVQAVVHEILVGRVHAQRQRARLEEAEQRPQLVVDHQGMALTATGGRQQHGLVDQGVLVDEVEEVLEQSGVGATKDRDRKSTRLNSSHSQISYAVFCLKKKKVLMIGTTYYQQQKLPHTTPTQSSHLQLRYIIR